MSVKIRLQRHGRKQAPYYHVVVADSRAPRDGKFIEKIGAYNPTTIPATIELNVDQAVKWLSNGAVPTDTCRAILSYKGALYKHHLAAGVRKGALTEDQATEKFNKWISEKESKVVAHVDKHKKSLADRSAAALAEEAKVKEARAQKIAEKLAAAEAAANPPAEVEETTEEAPVAEAEVTATDAPATEENTTPAE